MNKNLVWILVTAFIAGNLFLAFNSTNWIFIDESTYISASIAILNGQRCSITNTGIPTPTICNYEHPPLAKLLEVVSLYAFGWIVPRTAYPHPTEILLNITLPSGVSAIIFYPSGNLGDISSSPLWFLSFRFFQLVMGALSLMLIYMIARKISGNTRLALLSSLLLLLEPLYAFFSRTAYLDIPMTFFALCAYAVFFSSFRLGPVNEYWLAGAMLGLSVLSKEPGLVFLFPLVVYHIIFNKTERRKAMVKEIATILVGEIIVIAAGLQLYDTIGGTPFPTFLNQVAYIISFSTSPMCAGSCSRALGPFAWFTFFVPNYSFVGLSFNSILLWLIFLWIPLGLYSLWKSRGKQITSPENRFFVFAALLFGSTFVENVLFYLGNRTTWIWYFLTIVPSLALGGAYLIMREGTPRWAKIVLLALLFVGYFSAYIFGPNLLKFD